MKIELISGDFQVACDASARQAIAARTTARSQSPLGRFWLEIAAPGRCTPTSLPAVEAGYRNKTRLRSLWTTVLVLFRGLFKTPPRRDQKLAPRLSVIFTPTGPLASLPPGDCSGWMRDAGFNETRVEPLCGPNSMVVGIK